MTDKINIGTAGFICQRRSMEKIDNMGSEDCRRQSDEFFEIYHKWQIDVKYTFLNVPYNKDII